MKYRYHMIMSMYPVHEGIEWAVFWEQWKVMDETELDEFVANHPWCHQVIMIINKEEYND